jgi:formylmethanofuran dehydrogenase subunit E
MKYRMKFRFRKETPRPEETSTVCEQCGELFFEQYLSAHGKDFVCSSCLEKIQTEEVLHELGVSLH